MCANSRKSRDSTSGVGLGVGYTGAVAGGLGDQFHLTGEDEAGEFAAFEDAVEIGRAVTFIAEAGAGDGEFSFYFMVGTSDTEMGRTRIWVKASLSSILRKRVSLPLVQMGEVRPSAWRMRRLSR